MYVEENKTQLTFSCVYNMLHYGHYGVVEWFLINHNEKVKMHTKRICYELGLVPLFLSWEARGLV